MNSRTNGSQEYGLKNGSQEHGLKNVWIGEYELKNSQITRIWIKE